MACLLDHVHASGRRIRSIKCEDGVVLYVARDIADGLEYGDVDKAIRVNVPSQYKTTVAKHRRVLRGMHPATVLMTNQGCVALIMLSRKPKAEPFRLWALEMLTKETCDVPTFSSVERCVAVDETISARVHCEPPMMHRRLERDEKDNIRARISDLRDFPVCNVFYIMQLASDRLKIGITSNLNVRARAFRTTTPDAYVVKFYCTDMNGRLEHLMKDEFKTYRVCGDSEVLHGVHPDEAVAKADE